MTKEQYEQFIKELKANLAENLTLDILRQHLRESRGHAIFYPNAASSLFESDTAHPDNAVDYVVDLCMAYCCDTVDKFEWEMKLEVEFDVTAVQAKAKVAKYRKMANACLTMTDQARALCSEHYTNPPNLEQPEMLTQAEIDTLRNVVEKAEAWIRYAKTFGFERPGPRRATTGRPSDSLKRDLEKILATLLQAAGIPTKRRIAEYVAKFLIVHKLENEDKTASIAARISGWK